MKKLLCLLLTLNSFAALHANDVMTCKADILTSMCGGGEVSITLDTQKMSFKLDYGDVRCWYQRINIEGVLKETAAPYYLSNSHKYELVSNEGEVLLGKIITRSKDPYRKALAKLTISLNSMMIARGAVFGGYNLNCQ